MAKKKSLADQLADLDNTAPRDYDPEDLVEPMNDANLSEEDGSDMEEHDGRSHYVKMGKSSLRNNQPLLMDDPRYSGERTSRKELYSDESDSDTEGYDQDETVPFGAVDDDSEGSDDDDDEQFSSDAEEDDPQEDQALTEELQKIQEEEKTMLQQLTKSASDDVEKGQHVRQQLTLWDNVLEVRIRMQKVVENANRLPQHDRWDEIKDEMSDDINETKAELRQVLDDLMELRTGLLQSSGAVDVDELSYNTRKRHLDEDGNEVDDGYYDALWHDTSEVNTAFASYRNGTLEKWSNKVQASSTANMGKKFKAFDQNVLTQIDNVMAEKESLIKRTQLQRAEYAIVGKEREEQADEPEEMDQTQDRKKMKRYNDTYDEEIFDDNDFYQQQLRELIESRMVDNDDPMATGMRWAASKKDEVKKKKVKVDTKASKGRKLKFNVHEKIQNFMAPIPSGQWHDEMIEDLYSSLLGQRKLLQESAADDLLV